MGVDTRVERRLTTMSGTSGRPPSVDALARSGAGLPHPILVELARVAIAEGATDAYPERVAAYRPPAVEAVGNAAGVAPPPKPRGRPVAPPAPAGAQKVEFDLA